MLQVICTQLYPGHFSIRVGDSLWHSEEIVKIWNCTFQCVIITIIITDLFVISITQPGKARGREGFDSGSAAFQADILPLGYPAVMLKSHSFTFHNIIIIITIALWGAIWDHCKLSPTCMLEWPRRSRAQIMCNTYSTYHMQHVVCHVVWGDSSAIKFDRV